MKKRNDLHNALLLFLIDFLVVVSLVLLTFAANWLLATKFGFDIRKFQAYSFTFAISAALFIIFMNRVLLLRKNKISFNSRTSYGVFIVQCFLIVCMAVILVVAGVLMLSGIILD